MGGVEGFVEAMLVAADLETLGCAVVVCNVEVVELIVSVLSDSPSSKLSAFEQHLRGDWVVTYMY